MRVLLIGSGGREHALAWKISQSPLCKALFVAPGNAGTQGIATNVELDVRDNNAIITFCREKNIALVVIGPEDPLTAGICDALRAAGIDAFGPGKQAAEIEGSKAFMKSACVEAGIPTAAYETFTGAEAALSYVEQCETFPIVIKTDALAQGKGVIIAETKDDALLAVKNVMQKHIFGEKAGGKIIIEEFLEGEELSFFAFISGDKVVPYGSAQDHKRIGDGDAGPNTGGMGAYAPPPCATAAIEGEIVDNFVRPLAAWLKERGYRYDGVIFVGLMLTKNGLKLLEYNVRFGDPETQSLMALTDSDILPVLAKTARGELTEKDAPQMHDGAAICVVMAANGYPGAYRKGDVIKGIDKANKREGVVVFHAGTLPGEKGEVVTCGGRVLGVTARGASIRAARDLAYRAVGDIQWENGVYRKDVAYRALSA